MAKNTTNKYIYFDINSDNHKPLEAALWQTIAKERAAKLKDNPDSIKKARQERLAARQAFLADQESNNKPVRIRYAKTLSFQQVLEPDTEALAAIVQPTAAVDTTIQEARPKTEKPVFISQTAPTMAEEIDIQLTNLRNKLLYAFELDQRYDMAFLKSLPNAPQPLKLAQQTQHYIQKTAVQFKTKWSNIKENFEAHMVQLLTPSRQIATTLLAGISLVAVTQSQATPTPIKPITPATQINAPLQNLAAFEQFLKDNNINLTPTQINKTFAYAQRYVTPNGEGGFAEKPTETINNTSPAPSGAFGMSVTGLIHTGVFSLVSSGKSNPKNVVAICDEYNTENTETMAVPITGKNGKLTGGFKIVKLTPKTVTEIGSTKVSDIYTEKGAGSQVKAFLDAIGETPERTTTATKLLPTTLIDPKKLVDTVWQKIDFAVPEITATQRTDTMSVVENVKITPIAEDTIFVSDTPPAVEKATLLAQQPDVVEKTFEPVKNTSALSKFVNTITEVTKPLRYKFSNFFNDEEMVVATNNKPIVAPNPFADVDKQLDALTEHVNKPQKTYAEWLDNLNLKLTQSKYDRTWLQLQEKLNK